MRGWTSVIQTSFFAPAFYGGIILGYNPLATVIAYIKRLVAVLRSVG
jgi:hypothetical protein